MFLVNTCNLTFYANVLVKSFINTQNILSVILPVMFLILVILFLLAKLLTKLLSSNFVAPVVGPEPVNNLSKKSGKAHAIRKYLTNVSINPMKPFISKTISHVSS